MPDILHRVGIGVKADKVFRALTTLDGLAHWWTTDVDGEPKQGGVIDFHWCEMKVAAAKPGKLVKWKCIEGPKEWIGTEVTFTLRYKQGQTFVLFKHARWPKPVEFMYHCSTKWAVFLLSLKNWLERDEGRPAPYDMKLHIGD